MTSDAYGGLSLRASDWQALFATTAGVLQLRASRIIFSKSGGTLKVEWLILLPRIQIQMPPIGLYFPCKTVSIESYTY